MICCMLGEDGWVGGWEDLPRGGVVAVVVVVVVVMGGGGGGGGEGEEEEEDGAQQGQPSYTISPSFASVSFSSLSRLAAWGWWEEEEGGGGRGAKRRAVAV